MCKVQHMVLPEAHDSNIAMGLVQAELQSKSQRNWWLYPACESIDLEFQSREGQRKELASGLGLKALHQLQW